jgi:hypothetical protein
MLLKKREDKNHRRAGRPGAGDPQPIRTGKKEH